MRRLTVILLLVLIPALSHAQEPSAWMDESLTIGYNRSFGVYTQQASSVFWNVTERVQVRGGFAFHSRYDATEIGSTLFFPLNENHRLGVEGFGLGRWSSGYNINDYSLGVLGLWSWRGRLEVKAGPYFRWLSPAHGTGGVFEPFNLAYSLSFTALPGVSPFNFEASLTNLDNFTAERFYCPMLSATVSYKMQESGVNYKFYLRLREHSSGTFDLTSNFFDHQMVMGVVFIW